MYYNRFIFSSFLNLELEIFQSLVGTTQSLWEVKINLADIYCQFVYVVCSGVICYTDEDSSIYIQFD